MTTALDSTPTDFRECYTAILLKAVCQSSFGLDNSLILILRKRFKTGPLTDDIRDMLRRYKDHMTAEGENSLQEGTASSYAAVLEQLCCQSTDFDLPVGTELLDFDGVVENFQVRHWLCLAFPLPSCLRHVFPCELPEHQGQQAQ